MFVQNLLWVSLDKDESGCQKQRTRQEQGRDKNKDETKTRTRQEQERDVPMSCLARSGVHRVRHTCSVHRGS